jgi:Ca2+-binding EF-hand superfamily protein
MGQVCAGFLQKVANQEAFDRKQCGPTLRRLFGAYKNPDFWAVYRRFRAVDDGNGYVSYEELLQCVSISEHQSLFLWETFSQQNELIYARELMTVICIFSSATLDEKGKFLQALFDGSHTGMNTAAEVASALHMVLAVLTKCSGIPVKVKEVREQLKSILPDLLPTWVDALERSNGKSEEAFNSARFIGQIELEKLLPSIKATYETLPIAGPPPMGASQPPPPDWATPSSLEKGQAKVPEKKTSAAAHGSSAKVLSKGDLAHLSWVASMDDEDGGEGKENTKPKATLGADGEEIPSLASAKGWMVIYGTDFAAVAKDLHSFRHLFLRSVSTALGIPMGCIEVINISRGGANGGLVVEFNLQPSGRGGDTRDGETLKEALAQQLLVPHSALRKGAFKEYVTSAELVERPSKGGSSRPATSDGRPQSQNGKSAVHRRDQEVQTDLAEKDEDMKQILEDLETSEEEARVWQRRAEEAIADRDAAVNLWKGSSLTPSELEAALKELAELRAKVTETEPAAS